MLIAPRKLRPGSRIAALSLSSGAAEAFPGVYDWGTKQLAEQFGFEVVPMAHTFMPSAQLLANPGLPPVSGKMSGHLRA